MNADSLNPSAGPEQLYTPLVQLFVYYRIPKADIQQGLECARRYIELIAQHGLGTARLYQREEADKPYFTLMEVIHPAEHLQGELPWQSQFLQQLQELAAGCFACLPQPPARHTEIFTEIKPACA